MKSKNKNLNFGVVYDKFFVHYDDEGKVHLLSNEKRDNYKIFEIDVFLIEDFLTGKKDHNGYNIEYFFNLNKGIITDETKTVEYSKPLFQLIPVIDTYDSDIVLEHDKVNGYWYVTVSDEASDKLSILPALNFYVCKKNDPHYLYRIFTVSTDELQNGPVICEFITSIENDIDAISVATLKRFKNYNIRITQ